MPCSRTGVRAMRALLLPFLFVFAGAEESRPATREYYIAAVEIGWDYIHLDTVDAASDQRRRSKDAPQKYIKAVYREYTDSTYSIPKPRPPWAGIQGPVIHAMAGDRVVVHFKNLASQPYSISPVGVTYWKQSEGVGYDDTTSKQEKQDDAILPGGYYKYVWDINSKDGPTMNDPECLTYSYSSQVDTVRDFNSGLIGALLICNLGAFTDNGLRNSMEFVLLFAVFDETKSWYGEVGRIREKLKKPNTVKQYHTINGYVNSTLPGLTMCQGRDRVFWHLIGMGTAPEIHSIQFQDYTLQVMKHRKVSMEMTPMTFTTAEMKPRTPGRFLISCQIHAHHHAGMSAYFVVEDCPEPVTVPGPDLREVQHMENEYGDYEYGDYGSDDSGDLFSVFTMKPLQHRPGLRSNRGFKSWTHYIASEEISWDYAPHLGQGNNKLSSEYFPKGPQYLGHEYKKVAYVEYTDQTFTQRKSPINGLLGPLLRGGVDDQFQIIFKNLASRPYNIYPNGLTRVHPLHKSAGKKDLRSLAVPPNGTFGYVWKLTAEDGPLGEDAQCLTRLYQSTVDPERDLASGLVGPFLICKKEAMDTRGRLVSPDKTNKLMFAMFDENKSWYIDENIQKYSKDPSLVNPADPEFYNSNIIYNVNGIMFNSRHFKMCQSDVTFWHVANVGTQSDFLSIYFTGNPFMRDNVYESVLTLFPMSGETIPMETELTGEWEISAFDGSLKSRGMSIRYSVRFCDNLALFDDKDDEDDLSDYLEEMFPRGPRSRPQNRTVAVRVCKKPALNPNTTAPQAGNATGNDVTDQGSICEIRHVTLAPSEKETNMLSQGGIPQDILDELERDGEWTASKSQELGLDGGDGQGGRRQRRQSQGEGGEKGESNEVVASSSQQENQTEVKMERLGQNLQPLSQAHSESEPLLLDALGPDYSNDPDDNTLLSHAYSEPEPLPSDLLHLDYSNDPGNETVLNQTHSDPEPSQQENQTEVQTERLGQILQLLNHAHSEPTPLPLDLLHPDYSNETVLNHTYYETEPLQVDYLDLDYYDDSDNETAPRMAVSLEYDDYSDEGNGTSGIQGGMDVRGTEGKYRSYYIAAEEITWNYGIRKPHQLIIPREMRRGMRKFLSEYKKVVFRAYRDMDFQNPVTRGELQEHLGLMGPMIRAEINDLLTVTFKNMASRPYSLHLHGVYDKTQGEGPTQTQGGVAGSPGEAVQPGEMRVYNWRVTRKQGPTSTEFDCKAGAYYSTLNQEKDLHSGLIGPLLICKPGTLHRRLNIQPNITEYALLFHTFDETKSWYLEENLRQYCTPPCQADQDDTWFQISNKFTAINGYVAETLPGLMVAQHQPVRWHLLNVGGNGEYHAVHFHSLPFSVHKEHEHRLGVYNLYPGVFGTVEMRPSRVGTWLVECTVGEHQLAGMRARLLVYDPGCAQPLGMRSGRIDDSQITASDHINNWEPRLARLELSGSINAWMGKTKKSWIQVDLLTPTLVHWIQTQGARASLGMKDYFVMLFTLSYSLDLETWTTYRGNSTKQAFIFNGNLDGSKVNENHLVPPIVARYLKLQPVTIMRHPALRLELLGCDLNSCSLPLGLQKRLIPDDRFSASSFLKTWLHSWKPALARLHQEGSANAWRPKSNTPHEWLQVDFLQIKRITGVVTQGAWSMLTQMMVTEFSVTVSDNGHSWSDVLEEGTQNEKVFSGNSEPDEEVLSVFDPPLFARYLRIHPRGWANDIALRLEVLGCDTQQRL